MTPTRPFRPELTWNAQHALGLVECRVPGCVSCRWFANQKRAASEKFHQGKGQTA